MHDMDDENINLETNHIAFIHCQTDHQITEETTNYSNEFNIIVKEISWIALLIVKGISWIALLDRFACRSCVSKEFTDKCKIDILKLGGNNVKFLTVANGKALKIEGQAEVPVTLSDLAMTRTIFVIQGLSNPIILEVDWLTINRDPRFPM